MRQAGEWGLPESWDRFDRPKAANLPRDTCANRMDKRCFPCDHSLSSRLPSSFLPQRPVAFTQRQACERARGLGAEPVRHPGSGPSGIQTRWTQQDGDKNSKHLPKGWPGVWAAGRARMFPTHVGDVLASKSGSDPENPWKPPSAIPG